MTDIKYDVVAIGNAIVDVIGRCDDRFLTQYGTAKGSMRLVDAATADRLYGEMGPAVETSGGSAANTAVGVASFGGRSAFIGKVADDEFGRIFTHDLRAAGVFFDTPAAKAAQPTARSLILVTPDGERTMNTFLGVSPELDRGEVDVDLIRAASVLYLEGYLFDKPAAKAAFRQAADAAEKVDTKVALTLSDPFCVDRHRAEFLEFIRAKVDILFANEAEITSLYQVDQFDRAARLSRNDTKLAVLTRGAKGSLILNDDKATTIVPQLVRTVVDSTGAGDLYASGFLYGFAQGRSLETCGRLGSLAAAEIISHLGARPHTPLAQLAQKKGL